MGTRHLTVVRSEGRDIVTMYGQYDGYPTGHGEDLARFLEKFEVGNGVPLGRDKSKPYANGIGDLAAQIVARFKDGPGGFYLFPPGARDVGEEYIYYVEIKDEGAADFNATPTGPSIELTVFAGATTYFGLPGTKEGNMPLIFKGHPSEFDGGVVENNEPEEIPNDFLESQKSEE